MVNAELVEAIRQLLDDLGLDRAATPAVAQAGLIDLLGDRARELRGEIDALVVAADVGIGPALVTGEDTAMAAVEEGLVARGLAPEVAADVVATWQTAHREAAALRPTADLPPTEVPVADETVLPANDPVTTLPEPMLLETVVPLTMLSEDGAPPPLPPPPGTTVPSAAASGSRRRIAVASVVVAVMLVVAAGVAVGLVIGGGSGETAQVGEQSPDIVETPTTSTTVATSTTTTEPPTTTTSPAVPPSPTSTPTPTAGPTPTPTPEPTKPIAVADLFEWTPYCNSGGFYRAKLDVLANDVGPYDYVEYRYGPPFYGNVSYADGFIYYQPLYNGYYEDRVWYALRNGSVWSDWAPIDLKLLYNSAC